MTAVANAPLTMPLQRSPWHSPVPYLFGGLAAMLGLIAFALLILACSYWKLSASLESESTAERDLEAGGDDAADDSKPKPVLEEKFLVIMAGQEKPTYLATPMSSRTSSFGSNTSNSPDATTSSSEKSNQEDEDSKALESCGHQWVEIFIVNSGVQQQFSCTGGCRSRTPAPIKCRQLMNFTYICGYQKMPNWIGVLRVHSLSRMDVELYSKINGESIWRRKRNNMLSGVV